METVEERYECDVLVAGGGIAGLMAAIAAADKGARVIIAEKADVARSGDGVAGNDHFLCYIPELHGSKEDYDREFALGGMGVLIDKPNWDAFRDRSFEVAQDWEKWGIDMRPTGEYTCIGHAFPDRMRIWLKYDGRNQKAVLRKEALKRSVRIVNKTTITEFLTDGDGRICGALGINTSESKPEVALFECKALVTCSGLANRLYPSITAGMPFNTAHCPANAGGGRAAALRIGAKLVNMEMAITWVGPKYLERCGKASWIGLLSGPDGTPVGPFIDKPNKLLGDITADIWRGVFREKMNDGTGPVFMNCTGIDQEDMDYMMWAFKCEGIESLTEMMERQHFTLRDKMVEFVPYEPQCPGGIKVNPRCESSVLGLYAAGDESGNAAQGISGAAVTGRISGENAALYAAAASIESHDVTSLPAAQKAIARYERLTERTSGATYRELLLAVQQIMNDYVGIVTPRYEALQQIGLNNLRELEKTANETVCCETSHDLMRMLEAFDLLELGKIVCFAAMERRESRGMHQRIDCHYTNPLLNGKCLVVSQADGQMSCEWQMRG